MQDPSVLHPHVHPVRQAEMMQKLQNQIEHFHKEYLEKVELFNTNHRNLAECNHRIVAISTRINQLGGSNS